MKKRLIAGLSALMIMVSGINVYASETLPYSSHWETQADGNWRYKNTNGTYASGWIQDEVDQNYYYMNSSQVMLSGLVKSDGGRYYLLSQDHDGHYGRMLENGMTYHGITIQADTSETYRGALSNVTISQLRNIGLYAESAPDVSGSGHTTNGQTTPAGGNTQNNTDVGGSTSNNKTSIYDGMAVDKNDKDQVDCDLNGDGKLTGIEYNSYRALKAMDGIEQPSQNDGVHIS